MTITRVKYPCLILLLFIFSQHSFAQTSQNPVTIGWEAPKKIIDSAGAERDVLQFKKALHIGEYKYLPTYRFSIPGNVTEFKLVNVVTEALTSAEQKILPRLDANLLQPKIDVKYNKGRPVSIIYLIPLQEELGGIASKIISFEYSYQSDFNPPAAPLNSPSFDSRNKKAYRSAAASSTSVLSSGEWYKLAVSSSGLFKIDFDFLKSNGIDPTSINPNEIKIYGNGGGMLPQKITDFRHDDLVENAIFVHDEGAIGVFEKDIDYVLFYGEGPDTWKYNNTLARFQHTKNLYSNQSFYFLTFGSGMGLRVQDQTSLGTADTTLATFDERLYHHKDLYNIVNSGRDWYGEAFDYNTDQSFPISLPGIKPNSTLKLHTSLLGRSYTSSSFNVYINNTYLGSPSFFPIGTDIHAPKGEKASGTYLVNTSVTGSNFNVRLVYNKNSSSTAIAHLDFFEINVEREIKLYGNQSTYRSVASLKNNTGEFIVGNVSAGTKIWDITNPLKPSNQLYTLNDNQAVYSTNTDVLKEFIVFSGNDFEAPEFKGQLANQNLHGIDAPDLPDLIIVTHPDYLSAASRLAQFRKTNDNLDAEVVTTEQVYNEFSSGAQDVSAIRDFVKMLYDRKSGADSIRYLLLFGDASYDYKNRPGSGQHVPIYESYQSLHPIYSHSSDDYFGFLNDYSGEWAEFSSGDDTLQIGIGRLPVKNISEAESVVNKLINYGSSPANLGKWRNRLTFIADDGDSNTHLKDADYLSSIVKTNHKEYNINKIFLDAYPQISAPGGETCPQAKEAITQAVEKGTLVLNYTGHGGVAQLAQETLIDNFQVNNWENYNALTFFITATCEYGRYDDPNIVSGAEQSLLNSKGGAIGLITSTRPVYANTNKELNEAIYNSMFIQVNGNMPRLGDVMRLTKNNSLAGVNNRNYALLGDPSMMLAYPKEEVVVTKINGNPVSLTDTLKALSSAVIEGEVRDGLGNKLTDFTGSVYVTVYDKESVIQTFGTQGSSAWTFKAMNNLIYEGPATVTNGSFSITFVVPKDISYQFDKGKISLYALKNNSKLDANGFNTDIIIGGSETNFTNDNTPPKIKLYMNDESFVFGGLTGKNSLFLAKITDDNGINIAGQGIGHEITAVLDNSDDVIVLNEYYTAKKDNYKEGSVEYPFKNLSPGNHSIKFKCWDTHNNSEDAYLEFVVANDEKMALDHVLNYPNPFSTHTSFEFDHNKAGEDLDVMVQVYTVSGKLIKTLDNRFLSSPSHITGLVWDGRDDFGDKIGKGVYVYKVNVRSVRDGANVIKYQKLVLLN